MATQVDGTSSDVSAEMVGHAFVTKFYNILHESPDLVHKFYQDSSTMSRPGPDGILKTVTAMKGIDDLILSLDCKDYKAEILTADAQASHMEGVIVLVTGCLTGKDNVRRKFTETFFLAPQDKGYFVLNDAFRFVEEDSVLVDDTVEEESDKTASPAPPTPVQETINAPDSHTVAAEKTEEKVEADDVPNSEQKTTVTEVVDPQAPADSSKNVKPVVDTSSNGHVDAPKKSYASLLKNAKEGASTTQVHVPANTVKVATPNVAQQPAASPAGQQSHSDAVPATISESSAPNGSNMNGTSSDQAEDKGYSIYIGDLPYDATTELVEKEFKRFGRIRRNGIQVRSNKGYCFGFVEYEDASGKQNAIEMGTLRIAGKEAFIQEKKTSTRVVNGVSMYPSGRGSFRNDGFRGRGSYANGRGYGRNDYNNKRNGDIPPRSNRNGDGYQGVYQNGGGRPARQGGGNK